MSAAEIIAQLPSLKGEERKAIARRLRELEEQDENAFLHDAATLTFREMDRIEAEDARRKTS